MRKRIMKCGVNIFGLNGLCMSMVLYMHGEGEQLIWEGR